MSVCHGGSLGLSHFWSVNSFLHFGYRGREESGSTLLGKVSKSHHAKGHVIFFSPLSCLGLRRVGR